MKPYVSRKQCGSILALRLLGQLADQVPIQTDSDESPTPGFGSAAEARPDPDAPDAPDADFMNVAVISAELAQKFQKIGRLPLSPVHNGFYHIDLPRLLMSDESDVPSDCKIQHLEVLSAYEIAFSVLIPTKLKAVMRSES